MQSPLVAPEQQQLVLADVVFRYYYNYFGLSESDSKGVYDSSVISALLNNENAADRKACKNTTTENMRMLSGSMLWLRHRNFKFVMFALLALAVKAFLTLCFFQHESLKWPEYKQVAIPLSTFSIWSYWFVWKTCLHDIYWNDDPKHFINKILYLSTHDVSDAAIAERGRAGYNNRHDIRDVSLDRYEKLQAKRRSHGIYRHRIFWFLFTMTFTSFFACSLISPGVVPMEGPWLARNAEEQESNAAAVSIRTAHRIGDAHSLRWSEETGQYLPDNAFYCGYCKKCILGRDHHCPWVGNCIGFHNYKYYVLFLLYGLMGSLFIIYLTFETLAIHFSYEIAAQNLFRCNQTNLRVLRWETGDEGDGVMGGQGCCDTRTFPESEDFDYGSSSETSNAAIATNEALAAPPGTLCLTPPMTRAGSVNPGIRERFFTSKNDMRLYGLFLSLSLNCFMVGFILLVWSFQIAHFNSQGKILGGKARYNSAETPMPYNSLYQNLERHLGDNPFFWFLPIPGTSNPHSGFYGPGGAQWHG